jgi:cytochrome P450
MTLPPGPPLPAALQALIWARRPLSFLEACQRRYGDVFTLHIRNGGTWVVLANPHDVRRIFTTEHELLGVGLANSVLGPLLGPGSVMLLEEPEHLRRRRLMLPPFHGRRMTGYREMIEEVTMAEIRLWPRDQPFALWPSMQNITLEAIMRVVFGDLERPRMVRLRAALRTLTNWMNDPRRLTVLAVAGPSWLSANSGYRTVMEPVESLVLEELHELRARGEAAAGEGIAATLAYTRYEDGEPMSDPELRDELVTLLTDGPTSALLTWSFERLLREAAPLARLTEEVLSGGSDAYLRAVVKETMRLCPAAPLLMRRLKADMSFSGHLLPAGTTVAPCVHLIHHREELYPEPSRFRPERFLGGGAEAAASWIPFGGGVRRCLAASYAEMLMREVISTVIRQVELEPEDHRAERPLKSAITFVPHLHGRVRCRRRHGSSRLVSEQQLASAAGAPATA